MTATVGRERGLEPGRKKKEGEDSQNRCFDLELLRTVTSSGCPLSTKGWVLAGVPFARIRLSQMSFLCPTMFPVGDKKEKGETINEKGNEAEILGRSRTIALRSICKPL